MNFIYSFLIVISSWGLGAIVSQLFERRLKDKSLLTNTLSIDKEIYRKIGVDFFEFLVTKTIYGKMNRTIRINGISCSNLLISRHEMIKSEFGHFIGLLSSQLILFIVFDLRSELIFFFSGTAFNLILNLYPILLQQKNRSRINKIIDKYCC
ncbi:hypothetical protein [Algoriphagus halophilus]|uniref:glycosyl-4,4'-diaponeurosporenoate acyltransferase CrtO family protein n=1 Tax=Algoriphagus halophilus TaxID=226505 RepID=UPI00358E86C7